MWQEISVEVIVELVRLYLNEQRVRGINVEIDMDATRILYIPETCSKYHEHTFRICAGLSSFCSLVFMQR